MAGGGWRVEGGGWGVEGGGWRVEGVRYSVGCIGAAADAGQDWGHPQTELYMAEYNPLNYSTSVYI